MSDNEYEYLDSASEKAKIILVEHTSDVGMLKYLAKDSYVSVRCAVAGHRLTSGDVLKDFAFVLNNKIRETAAGNPNMPAEVLGIMAKDTSFNIRYRVANNPNCPKEALKLLMEDEDSEIVLSAVMNMKTRKG